VLFRAFLLAVLLLASPALAQDVFLKNVNGYTLQGDNLVRFDALLIKAGRVQAAGAAAILEPYAKAGSTRDMRGLTVLPGFVDTRFALLPDKEADEDQKALKQRLLSAMQTRLSHGVTMVHDPGVGQAQWTALQSLADTKALPMRVYGMIPGLGADFKALSAPGAVATQANDRLMLRAVELKITPNDLERPSAIRNIMARAIMRGYQVAVFMDDRVKQSDVISAYQDVLSVSGLRGRHRLFGGTGLRTDSLAQAAKLELIFTGETPTRSFAEAGADFTYASGAIFSDTNPFVRMADIRRLMLAPSREALFRAYTLGGAYAAFMENRLGSLETGKWADFIVLDRDIFRGDAAALRNAQVLETWVAGKKVFAR